MNKNDKVPVDSWESQIEQALIYNVKATYECFMALNMDKDKESHLTILKYSDCFSILNEMVNLHKKIINW